MPTYPWPAFEPGPRPQAGGQLPRSCPEAEQGGSFVFKFFGQKWLRRPVLWAHAAAAERLPGRGRITTADVLLPRRSPHSLEGRAVRTLWTPSARLS